MQRIKLPMFRYGKADFDKEYITWGLHDNDVQMEEAKSILHIVGSITPLRILDLACGIGTHAAYFAKHGHHVTAVDISATFVEDGRKQARQNDVDISFEVCDIKKLSYRGSFDLVTWIEKSFFDKEIVRSIYQYLADDGLFIFDIRNPENPKTIQRNSDWRTWREENGVFYLESHETDPGTGLRQNVWMEIDSNNDCITEKTEINQYSCESQMELLQSSGFSGVEYRTMNGGIFTGGSEPYWLWVVARK